MIRQRCARNVDLRLRFQLLECGVVRLPPSLMIIVKLKREREACYVILLYTFIPESLQGPRLRHWIPCQLHLLLRHRQAGSIDLVSSKGKKRDADSGCQD